MATILPGAGTYGGALATGLSQGLNNLLDSKLRQVNERNKINKTATALQALDPNLSPEQSQQIAQAPESLINQYFKNAQQQRLGELEYQSLQGLRGNLQPQPSQENLSQFGQQAQQPVSPATPGGQTPTRGVSQTGYIRPGSAVQQATYLQKEEQNLYKREQDRLNRLQQEQAFNLKRFKNEIDTIKTEAPVAQDRLGSAENALKLLNSNKFYTGPVLGKASQFTSDYIAANPALQDYDRLLNQFVVDSLGDLSGVATDKKAELIENTKTKITKSKESQENFWKEVIEKQKNKLNKAYAYEDILLENNNQIPNNFDSELNKRVALYKKMPSNMPKVTEVLDDSVYQDNGITWIIRNGHWVPIGKEL